MAMSTLHEIAVELANKQPGMVDSLTEDAPILDVARWQPATHNTWNVAEKMTDIDGPGFVEFDAPLPAMSASSDLVRTDLYLMGGEIQVPTMKAKKFGGPEKYFAARQDAILRDAGMKAEVQLVKGNWLPAARTHGNIKNAGATGKGWFILAVRFDELANCGLYDPDQFESGRMFRVDLPYGGAEHHLTDARYKGALGYTVVYRASFGWQILDGKRTCAAIVNIDEEHVPTPSMIDDVLADVRAQPGNTYLIMSPRARVHGINPHKRDYVMLANSDKDLQTGLESWSGIPILVSYNFNDKIANVK